MLLLFELQITIWNAKGIAMVKITILKSFVKPSLSLFRTTMGKTVRNNSTVSFFCSLSSPTA